MAGIPQIASGQNNKYATSNEADGQLEAMTQASLSVAMADADVILSQAQNVAAYEYTATGTLTAARALIFEAGCERRFSVVNSTSGGFDVVVRYPTGASVAVPAGTGAEIIGDGLAMRATATGAPRLNLAIEAGGVEVAAAAAALDFVNAASVVEDGDTVRINVAAVGSGQAVLVDGAQVLAGMTGINLDSDVFSATDRGDGTWTLGLAIVDENGLFQSPIGIFLDATLIEEATRVEFSSAAFAVTTSEEGKVEITLASGAAGTLGGLSDVDVSGVADGAVFRYFETPTPGWIDSSLDFGDLDRCDPIGALGQVLRVVDPGGGAPTRIGFVDPATLPGAGGAGLTASDLGNVSGPVALDASAADLFSMTVTGPVTLSFQTAETGNVFVTRIINGGTNVTFPASVRWPEGVPPTLRASGVDCIAYTTFDGGAQWYASLTTLGAA